tara:strand:- start:351 stop:1397 length:1047 start_codon:yes stop_codon:yes gene_type:complete
MAQIVLKSNPIEKDEILEELSQNFDYEFSGVSETCVPTLEELPKDFQIGLIVGPSGSGKSTMLKLFNEEKTPVWSESKAIASHFDSAQDAQDRLSGVGLNSVPAWFRPYHILSTGEQYRANLARKLNNEAVVDEFTSVVDRSVAKSCSRAVSRYIKSNDIHSMVFASCHYDIIEWLEPDWVFDTLTQKYLSRGLLWRPKIELEVVPCSALAWSIFSKHHYLSANLNKSAKHWMCSWDGTPVAFTSVIAMPSGTLKNAFRGHRTVVFPDYQGLGIGVRLSDAIGQIYVSEGKRYFSKTTHPRMGAYRNASNKWKATSKNMRVRGDFGGNKNIEWEPRKVFSYSHEFIGG